MSVVPLMDAHVDANFKEVQLQRIRPGQKVELTADLYGDAVIFHGRVSGLGGGTGSAFAVIPAQNATGNWIKVVQRLPVRIALDADELARNPLRVGVSMTAKIHLDQFDDAACRVLRTATLRTDLLRDMSSYRKQPWVAHLSNLPVANSSALPVMMAQLAALHCTVS